MHGKKILAAVVIASALVALSGCSTGSSSSSGGKTIKVAYEDFGSDLINNYMKSVAKDFEAKYKGDKVTLVPIKAAEGDYYTKLALLNRTAATAPDILYEDTFLIKSDAAAGYLEPLNSYVNKWSDWSQFYSNAKQAGEGVDGKTYGISMGTDVQAIWYNKDIFAKAGITVPWQPKSWSDLLDAAKTIKAKVPSVTPINIYSGMAAGEAASMRGPQLLLTGTKSSLYDTSSKKWIVGDKDFTDTLGVLKTIYQGGLGLDQQTTSNANYPNIVSQNLLPEGKLAIDVDGSWLPGAWKSNGAGSWPQWDKVMGIAAMPTQDGAAPGTTSISGGWTLAMGSKSKAKDVAWKFLSLALDQKHSLLFDTTNSQIAVRKDVADDKTYSGADSSIPFLTSLVGVTHFRPATTDYTKISYAIQQATESVMTGQATPTAAAKTYDTAVIGIVGKKNTKNAS